MGRRRRFSIRLSSVGGDRVASQDSVGSGEGSIRGPLHKSPCTVAVVCSLSMCVLSSDLVLRVELERLQDLANGRTLTTCDYNCSCNTDFNANIPSGSGGFGRFKRSLVS